MLHKEAKQKLADVMRKCMKAIYLTTDGHEALYASNIGNECKKVYNNLDSYSDSELNSAMRNVLGYENLIDSLLASLGN